MTGGIEDLADPPKVDIRSARFKLCLHLCAHYAVADALGWRVRAVVVYDDNTGHTHTSPPPGISTEQEVLQRVAILLAGPAASRRVSWLLPPGCRWDEATARGVLRRAHPTTVTLQQGSSLATALVERRWPQVRRHAYDLHRGGEWLR